MIPEAEPELGVEAAFDLVGAELEAMLVPLEAAEVGLHKRDDIIDSVAKTCERLTSSGMRSYRC